VKIKNGQSRETGNIGTQDTGRRQLMQNKQHRKNKKDEQQQNVGHHNMTTYTKNTIRWWTSQYDNIHKKHNKT
jgi:hypothetical protein